ncbi:MAG: ribonuclease Z [Geobacteraceae bacterium]|nr:ribonuclease Z [Geobacteraceae bacterium]
MKPLFHPGLVNGPFEDPALYIDFLFEKRAVLFDLGDLQLLPPRKILRISDVFVSHTHMDHFVGFDRMLRIMLARDKVLRLFGPPGFNDRVEHRLASYTWNLVESFKADFTIMSAEFDGNAELRSARFRCRKRFRRETEVVSAVSDGILLDEDAFRIRAILLDHGIPCLAFALEEKDHVNIMKNRLLEMGLGVGPWLNELKSAVLRGGDDDMPFRAWWREDGILRETWLPLRELRENALRLVPGQKIAYVTDALCSDGNSRRIVELARGADYLFIEAMFMMEDQAMAREKRHLAAGQAGRLAGVAGVGRPEIFHVSPKYSCREEEVRREFGEAFIAGMNLRDCS